MMGIKPKDIEIQRGGVCTERGGSLIAGVLFNNRTEAVSE